VKYLLALILLPIAMHDCGACYGAPVYGDPLAHNLIYLDFTTVPSTATPDQVDQIKRIVAAAFNPFDVAIVSDFPGVRPDVAWCILGGQFVPDPTGQYATLAGQSPVGVWRNGTLFSPYGTLFAAHVYSDGLDNDPTLTGRTAIHEIGHNVKLEHQADGFMAPNPVFALRPTDFQWVDEPNVFGSPQDDIGVLTGELDVFAPPDVAPDTAEPGLLLLVPLMLMGRNRRGAN
jgi:hypothetical protein